MTISEKKSETKKIGIAADHGGFVLKQNLKLLLQKLDYEVMDFGNNLLDPNDDYPDFVIPLAKAISEGKIDRGIAVCGSGVGASIVANKINGVRACLINETFSARQGVEDDNMNIICLGGRVSNNASAGKLVKIFLSSQYSKDERHQRRLNKISVLETEVKKADKI
jgi:ribose 5-phosphate isomerase B